MYRLCKYCQWLAERKDQPTKTRLTAVLLIVDSIITNFIFRELHLMIIYYCQPPLDSQFATVTPTLYQMWSVGLLVFTYYY